MKGRKGEAQAVVRCEGAPSSQQVLSPVGAITPALSGAGFLSGLLNLDRGEETPADTKWAQREGVYRQVEPCV